MVSRAADTVFLVGGKPTVCSDPDVVAFCLPFEVIKSGLAENGARVVQFNSRRPEDIGAGCQAQYLSDKSAHVVPIDGAPKLIFSGRDREKMYAGDTPPYANPAADTTGFVLCAADNSGHQFAVPEGSTVYITAGDPKMREKVADELNFQVSLLAEVARGVPRTAPFRAMDPIEDEFKEVLRCALAVLLNKRAHTQRIAVVSMGRTTAGIGVFENVANLLAEITAPPRDWAPDQLAWRRIRMLHKKEGAEDGLFGTQIALELNNMLLQF